MKGLSEQVPEGELDSSGPNDVFSKVMDKERFVGDCVYFKSVANPIEDVDKGWIVSMDPSTEVVRDDDDGFIE
ncbi:hypothetical protein RHGRI_005282 [Rhododendron griersonianum]|uniref:Uncharacterized protein n=1 Tax=Rhododendron griersonianum TaxID=479676 RepID=A0AAV6LCQ4_9ERIC|nr:hypothetical protein RHGRI_005282 [Rhododendron griersonianum]